MPISTLQHRLRHRPRATRLVIPVVLAVLSFGACSARQEIFLRADGSGDAALTIQISAPLAAYLADLGVGLTGATDAPLFDLAAIEAAIQADPNLTLRRIGQTDARSLSVNVDFQRIDALLAARSQLLARAFRFDTRSTSRRVTAQVGRETVERSFEALSIDPAVAQLLLPPEGKMSAREYRDYLIWALEEYEAEAPLARLIDTAAVETIIRVDGRIEEVAEGVIVTRAATPPSAANPADRSRLASARFLTGVTAALTAARPIEYLLVFQPR